MKNFFRNYFLEESIEVSQEGPIEVLSRNLPFAMNLLALLVPTRRISFEELNGHQTLNNNALFIAQYESMPGLGAISFFDSDHMTLNVSYSPSHTA